MQNVRYFYLPFVGCLTALTPLHAAVWQKTVGHRIGLLLSLLINLAVEWDCFLNFNSKLKPKEFLKSQRISLHMGITVVGGN